MKKLDDNTLHQLEMQVKEEVRKSWLIDATIWETTEKIMALINEAVKNSK